MRWTKRHSQNAVAAKARKRMDRATAPTETGPRRKVAMPRSNARFQLTIRDWQIGDSITLSLTPLPWRGRFVDSEHNELNTAQICRMLQETLNHE